MESLLAHDVDTVGWLLTKFSAGISLEMNVMYNVHVHQKQIFRKYNIGNDRNNRDNKVKM